MGTSTQLVATTQSVLFGDNKGTHFNDLETVLGIPANVTINVDKPITSITVMHGYVVDGIEITYSESDSAATTTTVSHGTSSECTDLNLKKSHIYFGDTENIIAVSGLQGVSEWGLRILQLSFVIYDSKTGGVRVEGPFGGGVGDSVQPFRFTANGILIGFGGFAVNTDTNLGSFTSGETGGLYGLTFFDVAYRCA
ncbi:hypothetical protein EST38_g12964 [Candolleomyces aberdarensis]|uniref:Jacalin-type lectin domain-containing protein n=1 Tax=Candolleomyces aberdarensis TaxID=2316362 RepID=A0A4Q2D142_9AGAR|nr:hypothetical protein EST38_g12964 [Candolleomyces aberdarensis]